MARTNRYSEEKLLESVILYSDAFPEKQISARALARWASGNVAGLEGVRGYHYTRPAQTKDPKTGKTVPCPKECLKKIEEINALTCRDHKLDSNPVLSVASIDRFFELSVVEQRKYLQEARDECNGLRKDLSIHMRRNALLKAENADLQERCMRACELQKNIRTETERLNRLVSYLKKKIDDETAKKALAEIGITDGMLKLTVYMKKIYDDTKELFDVREAIRTYLGQEQEGESWDSLYEGEDAEDPGTEDSNGNEISDLVDSLYDF